MRKSGLLLHITSLASKYGIGDLGPQAYKFADFLAESKQRVWQILPLNPPAPPRYSPYNSFSAFAGNTALISPEFLYREGLLTKKEIQECPKFAKEKVQYAGAISYKTKLLKAAYERFEKLNKTYVIASEAKQSQPLDTERLLRRPDPASTSEAEASKSGLLAMTMDGYGRFCEENHEWLEDYAVFTALQQHFRNRLWCEWPVELRDRHVRAMASAGTELRESISREKFLQYLFFEQWFNLKRYCNRLGIEIIGDIPIYVAYQSADVWSHPEIFKLDRNKRPTCVSGVPPDLFSKTGQLWGNPIYNWRVLKNTNYGWWFERLGHNLSMLDRVRIDHFRGFFGFWQVPAGDKTAKNGKWVRGPGKKFFDIIFKHFPKQAIIAEDLGHITNDVKSYVKSAGLAGMRVLQFGFGGNPKTNPHFPGNHIKNSICYTGTHDNNTIVGWFKNELSEQQKIRLFDCLGHKPKAGEIHWEMIRLAFGSKADLAIVPVQDILGLGPDARMNRPARALGNWKWRLKPGQFTHQVLVKLAQLTRSYRRF
jgi:4-alpha-glucanotransferase